MLQNVPYGTKIRVLMVDDLPLVLSGIRGFLSTQKHIDIVGEAYDGEEAVAAAKRLNPDIILMDISMPNMSGIEATKRITKAQPVSRVIMLTMYDEKEYIKEFINCGAHGYLLKTTSPTELVDAINRVHEGEAFVCPAAMKMLLENLRSGSEEESAPGLEVLSEREREIFVLVTDGLTSKEIGTKLFMPIKTVEKNRQQIGRKLGLHGLRDWFDWAKKHGLL